MQTDIRRSLKRDTDQFFEVTYLYRDAANYKCWGTFVIRGTLQMCDLIEHMISGEFFVPEAVGIPQLTPEHWTEDDHAFHEIHSIESCGSAPCAFTAGELIGAFRRRNKSGWL